MTDVDLLTLAPGTLVEATVGRRRWLWLSTDVGGAALTRREGMTLRGWPGDASHMRAVPAKVEREVARGLSLRAQASVLLEATDVRADSEGDVDAVAERLRQVADRCAASEREGDRLWLWTAKLLQCFAAEPWRAGSRGRAGALPDADEAQDEAGRWVEEGSAVPRELAALGLRVQRVAGWGPRRRVLAFWSWRGFAAGCGPTPAGAERVDYERHRTRVLEDALRAALVESGARPRERALARRARLGYSDRLALPLRLRGDAPRPASEQPLWSGYLPLTAQRVARRVAEWLDVDLDTLGVSAYWAKARATWQTEPEPCDCGGGPVEVAPGEAVLVLQIGALVERDLERALAAATPIALREARRQKADGLRLVALGPRTRGRVL